MALTSALLTPLHTVLPPSGSGGIVPSSHTPCPPHKAATHSQNSTTALVMLVVLTML